MTLSNPPPTPPSPPSNGRGDQDCAVGRIDSSTTANLSAAQQELLLSAIQATSATRSRDPFVASSGQDPPLRNIQGAGDDAATTDTIRMEHILGIVQNVLDIMDDDSDLFIDN